MKHKIIFSFAVLAFIIFGCSNPQSNSTTNSPNNLGQTKRVAFVTNNASDYWTIARKGTEKADGELADITVEFKIPSDGTAAEQTRIINDLVAGGISGIAVSPVDPANQVQLINDTAKKSLVITQDSDAATSDRAVYIGTDNKAAGRQAGELIEGCA
jgi:ribose transport system substrate-binding protein